MIQVCWSSGCNVRYRHTMIQARWSSGYNVRYRHTMIQVHWSSGYNVRYQHTMIQVRWSSGCNVRYRHTMIQACWSSVCNGRYRHTMIQARWSGSNVRYRHSWSLLYSAILRSRADSLHSHAILHEWLVFCCTFLNTHRNGVLTALAWLVPHETVPHLGLFCVHHASMHHVTSCKATYVRYMCI